MHASVLVVAAHPDDEVLGCGGTMARLAARGAIVNVAFLSDGVTARESADAQRQAAELQARREAASKACTILGARVVLFGDAPDNRLDTIALLDIVQPIEKLIATHRPDTIFTHHGGDLNVDHRRVHEAVATACRPQSGHPVKTLLSFEVPSSTEWQLGVTHTVFVANWFSDITDTLSVKLAALEAYAAELRDWPHPRSLKGVEYLARVRGATVGVQAAEAFMLGRQLS